jgi:ankyrin repeat protein
MSGPYFPFQPEIGYYADRAEGRVSYGEGALSLEDARSLIARQHGEADWAALERRLEGIEAEPFRQAFLAVEAADVERLRELLDREPWLALAQGTNGNDLLNMTRDLRIAELLLERGADPARGNDMGWTPLHQVAYGNSVAGVRLLLAHGGDVGLSARGEGGTPLVVALFWGHREASEELALHGTPPGNLRVAAGLGRLDEIAAMAPGGGRIAGRAAAARGFYRPHSGFPTWSPSGDADEVLGEALAWAARSDRADAVRLLVERGARVDADVYRGTALAWAAACGRLAAIEALLACGAAVDGRGTFGGPDHGGGVTALHLAAQSGEAGAVRALLAAGADPSVHDAIHDAPPSGWASFGGHEALADELRAAAGGG